MNLPEKRPILLALAICCGTAQAISAGLTISMEAQKEAIVDVFTPDAVDIPGFPEYMLPGNDQMLAYIAFDLTRLPQGSRIVEATITVFDAEPLLEDVNEIALLNVSTDWEAATLSFNTAVAQYGAAEAVSSQNYAIAVYDTEKVLWLGSAVMDNTDAPGEATINSTRDFQSVSPYVDDELVEALNEDLANDDGMVTLAIRGQSGEDNFLIGIDYPDGEAGPTLTVVLALPGESGETTTYDFDDGTLQGWTQVSTSTREGGPTELGLISDTDPPVGNSVPPLALSSPSFLGPVPFEAEDNTNTRDQAHDTLVVRSPEFGIYPNGQISFALIGGSKPGFDLETINAEGLPEASSGSGAIGVALRRVSDGEYLAFRARATDGSQFWETITLGEEELTGLVEGEETYTLDFVDFNSGGWGWAALDSVIIVEGTPVRSYDFDDGTLQGWTQVSTSDREGGPTELGLISDTDPPVGNSVPPLALSSPSFLGPVPFEAEDNTNTRDQAHDTLVVRSPEFGIHSNGQISFALIGGSKPGFDLETINAEGLPEASSGSGAIGVALRRVSDGEYLAFRARATDGSQFWETITLGEEELAGLVEGEESYTLDFVDFNSGGWGWAALDSVIIVEGASPQSSSIAVSRNDEGEVVVTFDGQLQFAPTVNGPWSDVDATSPYTWKPDSSVQFGRSVSR